MSIQIIYPNLEKKKILKNQQGSMAYIGLGWVFYGDIDAIVKVCFVFCVCSGLKVTVML